VELSWTTTDSDLKWPWLVVLLVLALVVLLAVWTRTWWRRQPPGAAYVAHAARLRSLPRYRTLVQRQRLLGGFGSLAALVACAGGIVLGGRVQETQVMDRDEAARDIMLCLDASGSTAPWNVDVVQEFRSIVEGLQGERIGLTVWNNAAITKFPLTDDYEFVLDRLDEAEQAFSGWSEIYPSEAFEDYTAGTWSEERQYQSSLVADGLVSCVQRFDRLKEDRGRALVLATDGEQRGRSVYDLEEATAYAAEDRVVVHVIANPGEPDKEGDIDGLQAAAADTGGSFAQLGTGGSAEEVVEEINELEAAKIERPPLVQTLDAPRAGQVLTAIGVGLLVLVWTIQGVAALGRRRRPTR
jgi:Ca-activated chloride channel family protein